MADDLGTAISRTMAAIALDRQRLDARPGDADAFDELAGDLQILAGLQVRAGMPAEAQATTVEATRLRRELAIAEPDAERVAELAVALDNLALRLAATGDDVGALQAVEEAVGYHRQLAEGGIPDARTDLARSLSNLCLRLVVQQRVEEAHAAGDEAVQIFASLAGDAPEVVLAPLAEALNNVSNVLSVLGRRDEALATAEDAVTLRRQLADAGIEDGPIDLAAALYNLALRLAESGQSDEALAASDEAVALFRGVVASGEASRLPLLAQALAQQGLRLTEGGLHRMAFDADREAALAYLRLERVEPARWSAAATQATDNLLVDLRNLGYDEPAALAEVAKIRDGAPYL